MRTAFATFALTLLAPSAAAQAWIGTPPGTAADAETIVVTGSQITDRAVADFVNAVTIETSGDQLAAFHAPICPASFGLPEAYNRVIERRIRTVAAEAEIEVADEGCSPNIILMAVNDGQSLLARLRSTHGEAFGGLDAAARRRLREGPGPVRAWQVTEIRGSDGRPAQRISMIRLPSGQIKQLSPTAIALSGVRPSRLTRSTRQDLSLSFVVMDVAALDGLSLGQIGDYAAMRALAQTDPEEAAATGQPTILGLFADRKAGRSPVDAMTEWDSAFLRSLYKTRRTVSAGLQRPGMTRMVRDALENGGAARAE